MDQNENTPKKDPNNEKRPKNIWITILIAVGIVLHQAVDHVGCDGQLVGLAGDQVVQGGDFSGVQSSVHSILGHGLGSLSGVSTDGCAGGLGCFLTAAGNQAQGHCQNQQQGQQSLGVFHNYHSFLVLCLNLD